MDRWPPLRGGPPSWWRGLSTRPAVTPVSRGFRRQGAGMWRFAAALLLACSAGPSAAQDSADATAYLETIDEVVVG